MFYFVYVLLSRKDHQFYIGFTKDIERRLGEHNTGKNIFTSKSKTITVLKTAKGKVTLRMIVRNSLSRERESLEKVIVLS